MKQLSFRNLWIKLFVLVLAALATELVLAQSSSADTVVDTIVIEHTQGTTEVPKHPERVVVIGEEILELAQILDLNVVGLAAGRLNLEDITSKGTIKPEVLANSFFRDGGFSDVSYVGTWIDPSLEAILALQPDLIIRTYWGQDGYEALSKIAPTLSFSQTVDNSWRIALRELAKLVDAKAKAEQVIKDLANLYDDLQGQLEEAGVFESYPKVIVLSPFAGGEIYMYPGDRVANIMRELGFDYAFPAGADPDAETWSLISEEAVLQIGGDTLIVAVASDGFEGKEQSLELMEASDGLVIKYDLENMSPWTGPRVDRTVANAVVESILSATQDATP